MKREGTPFDHELHVIDESICRKHRQLLNWDAPGRRRNHIHQINCWTLSAFLSELSYEKHEEKETWEGRRTWERARCITHWSGTWSLFLSYASEAVWAGGAAGLQLVMQWEPSSETQGRICGWQRRHREGKPRHQPQPGGSGNVHRDLRQINRKNCKVLTECRVSLGPPWLLRHPWDPCPPPLCCLQCWKGGGWWCGTHHIQNHREDLRASASPQERWRFIEFQWGGGGSFWWRTGQIPP